MRIGYARTSTDDQKAGLEAQLRDIKAAGCEKIFHEEVSSVDIAKREQFNLAMDFVREGDTLVVTKLDRLARSVSHLLTIIDALKKKNVGLHILNLGIDISTPTGKLVLKILGVIAEFEREIMLERQREGIAKAKREGKYKGRAPTARRKTEQVLALHAERIGQTEIARRLDIGRSSVYRIIRDHERKKTNEKEAA